MIITHPHQGFSVYRNWRVASVSPPGSGREEGILNPIATRLRNKKINHVVKLVDVSGSMRGKESAVIKVLDNQVAFMAQLSRDTDQETRVTIYFFDDQVECVVFDTDVLRLPSIADLYHVRGRTALRDAFIQSQSELAQTCQLYGDHAFLMFGFTDGYENASVTRPYQLTDMLKSLPANWTTAIFVPDINGKLAAVGAGFPEGNVAIWNTNSATGVEEVGQEMQKATSDYFNLRASGVSGTRTLFATDPTAVNAATIQAAGLQPLAKGTYDLVTVPKIKESEGVLNKDKKRVWELAPFVTHNGLKFVLGRNYYRLSKQEAIKGDKELAVREKSTNKVFVGDGVRDMIGLSDKNQRVAPDKNPEYDIFVQSKSNNRHLFQGDEILILK
jgi:hypothetical protein